MLTCTEVCVAKHFPEKFANDLELIDCVFSDPVTSPAENQSQVIMQLLLASSEARWIGSLASSSILSLTICSEMLLSLQLCGCCG
jgi:hypothetical protein